MLALISPAKKLDFETDLHWETHTQPLMLKQAEKLAEKADGEEE